jgi:hypothetical protein
LSNTDYLCGIAPRRRIGSRAAIVFKTLATSVIKDDELVEAHSRNRRLPRGTLTLMLTQ